MSFRPKNEHQLSKLSDDDLVAYLIAARDAGHDDEVRKATGILVYSRYRQQLAFIRKKVRSAEDAEDILATVTLDMLSAAFRGNYTGQFFSLFFTIRDRRIADFHEKAGREPEAEPVNPEGPDLIEELLGSEEFAGESEVRMLIDECLESVSPRDQEIVRMRRDGFPSKEVADRINQGNLGGKTKMTPANVDQIYARFKHRLHPELFPEDGGEG